MKTVRTFTLMVLCATFLIGMTTVIDSGEAADNGLHIYLKEDFSAIPEPRAGLDSPGTSIRAEAVYVEDPVFETRSEKQWVDFGTWFAPERVFEFRYGDMVMNYWYQIHQEGYDAEPEIQFQVWIGDGWDSSTSELEDPGNDDILPRDGWRSISPDRIVAPDDEIRIEIRYRGYEDCSLYFDNITYDTGLTLGADWLRPFNFTAEDHQVEVEVCDAFNTSWENVVDLWNISIDNVTVEIVSRELESAGTTIINGTEVNVTKITWIIDEPLVQGAFLELWMTYHLNYYEILHGMKINLTVESNELIRPVAEITSISPDPANEGEEVTLDASDSSDEGRYDHNVSLEL